MTVYLPIFDTFNLNINCEFYLPALNYFRIMVITFIIEITMH